MKILLVILTILPFSLWAIPEEGLEAVWKDTVHPWFETLNENEFQNAQNRKVKFHYFTKNHNTKSLVIVPGRSEPAVKYAELAYDLRNKGVDIFIIDHQGQGDSERLLEDSNKGHVVNFEDYVRDFSQFMKIVRQIKNNKETFVIAHSMGGAIAVRYISANPKAFNKAILSAPMMKLNTDPYSEVVARYYSKLLVGIGKGSEYAPGYGPYDPNEDVFDKNTVTHSEERFNVSKHILTNWPHLAIGGPTARWVHESLKATKKIDLLPFKTKTILFQAGLDQIVINDRQTSFCKKKSDVCQLRILPQAKHEVLMEKDSIRNSVIEYIHLFFGL